MRHFNDSLHWIEVNEGDYFGSPFGDEIFALKFTCIDCSNDVCGEIAAPCANFESENISGSGNDNWDSFECEHCGKGYNVNVYNNQAGQISFDVDPSVDGVEYAVKSYEYDDLMDYELETIIGNKPISNFNENIKKVEELINNYTGTCTDILYQMSFVNAVTILETFLGDTFIN